MERGARIKCEQCGMLFYYIYIFIYRYIKVDCYCIMHNVTVNFVKLLWNCNGGIIIAIANRLSLRYFYFRKVMLSTMVVAKITTNETFFYRNLMQIGFCYGGYMEKFSEF